MILLDSDFPDVDHEIIERKAQSLLEDFYHRPVTVYDTPIPVERIAEFLDYEIDIIEDGPFFKSDILGGIVFDDRVIQVASTVADHEGRYSFTIAHEIGHHILHREIYLARKENEEQPAMCREKGRKPKAEQQADRFAAAILMPIDLLEQAIDRSGLKKALKNLTSVYDARQSADQIKKTGSFLNVSNTAILNRLIDLKHIINVPYQSTAEKPHLYRSARQLTYTGTLIKKFLTKIVSSK